MFLLGEYAYVGLLYRYLTSVDSIVLCYSIAANYALLDIFGSKDCEGTTTRSKSFYLPCERDIISLFKPWLPWCLVFSPKFPAILGALISL